MTHILVFRVVTSHGLCQCLEEQVKEFIDILANVNGDKANLQQQQMQDMHEIEVIIQQLTL